MPTYDCVFHNVKASELYANCRHVDARVLRLSSKIIWNLCQQISRDLGRAKLAIVEAGVGSGRLFIPLLDSRPSSMRETIVIGLDVAQPMLDALNKNISSNNGSSVGPYSFRLWDIQYPYPTFESPVAVVLSLATFHILQEWKDALANAVNILVQNGRLVLIKEINQFMHQTEGFEGNLELESVDDLLSSFMREYHRLRSAFGLPFIRDGILYSDFDPAVRELKNIGFGLLEIIKGPELCWQKPHRYSEMLLMLKERVITTWGTDLPDKGRHTIADKLENWLWERRVDLDMGFNIPARFEIYIFGSSS